MKEKKEEKQKKDKEAKLTAVAAVPESQKQLEKATAEAKENYDKWLYLRADFENYKKRSQKDVAAIVKFGHERFAHELLQMVDTLERGMKQAESAKEGSKAFAEGIRLTLKQCVGIFGQFGIRPIESINKKFDPAFHEAVAQEETDKSEEEIILKEHRKGYMIYDRLLRAAQVVVSKQKEKSKENK